ncbi:MAG: hypothetical protein E7633_04070 [Ruminococcaceae bacterium]|nr:hypothetical protein [Oscillospiraceae bacterium]
MRTLDERKAEVYRRSEIISVKRRKRTRILLFTIPTLFVCVIISSVIVNSILNALNTVPQDENKDVSSGIVRGEWGDDIFGPIIGNTEDDVLPETEGESKTHRINITDPSGKVTEYTLKGNTLWNITKGEMRKLTDEQLKTVKKLFGIADE